MKNVTVTLQPEVARWARVRAAEQDMSLSRFLGELLRKEMTGRAAYETAMQRYLAHDARPLRSPDDPLPRRDELHER